MEKHPQTSSEETTRSLCVLWEREEQRQEGELCARRVPGVLGLCWPQNGADGFLHLTLKLAKARQRQEFLALLLEQNGCLGVGETSPEPAAGWAGLWLCTAGW